MLRRCVLTGVVLSLASGPAFSAVPDGTPLFIELPVRALAIDVGAGGFVVGGNFYGGGGFVWMPTSGITPVGGTVLSAVSRDGKVITGSNLDEQGREQAAIWQGGQQWKLLGSFTPDAKSCDRSLSSSFGTNGDGSVVVGLAWDGCGYAHGFRWEESTGLVDLGTLNGESTRANAVSTNGRVIVGWQQDRTGFRLGAQWVDGVETLFKGPRGTVGEAFAVNGDGSLVAGTQCDPNDVTPNGWTWTAATGVRCLYVDRPPWVLPNFYRLLIQAVSDDGRVMGGGYSFGLESQALVVFDGQVYFLRDYLRDHGIPDAFDGWVNTGFVLGVTSDGRTIVGYGAGPKGFQGYVVVLPEMPR